ncbi:type-F conjugative transfer system pilin assembly protein TrbC [Vibrio sp. B172a]|uniref:type-F conjugative transfer system pilin assembly protein TrbC n=1 Tax=Vibrio sp. B172a TaxID=2835790 RepID=UPI0025540176|nr:type-F conjugative transfer system pilin assembly protein TrbC [Vibrio sp. B172a]MDK9783752.1 type-F conjugative transfer system pilin assembly protein TrbC [Vibrio sp. B172a]
MPSNLNALLLLPALLVSPLSLAKVGYSQDELNALAKQEQAVAAPESQSEIARLIEQSQQYRQEALSMHQHMDNALKDSPLASVLGTPTPNPNKEAQGVMVFVSLSMPDQALRQLLRQSQEYQVPLVIRGVLPEGFVPTTTRITSLLEKPDKTHIESGLAINPEWFRQFNITHVPAFVSMNESCTQAQCSESDYDIVYGNVSLPSALEILSQGDVGYIAKQVLKRKTP